MSAPSTPGLTPAEQVLKAARTTIDKEMAALNAGDGESLDGSEEMLRFRAAFVSFLEAEVREGMEAGDAIYGASVVGAFLRGVFVSASCDGCQGCVADAAAELAETLLIGAGIKARVTAVPATTATAKHTTKH